MPARDDYARPRPVNSVNREEPLSEADKLDAVYAAALVFKNTLGAVLVLGGLAMLVLPGQGVLSILIGTSLLSLPGKRRLERWIVRSRAVMRGLNWIRRRAGQPPLEPPEDPAK